MSSIAAEARPAAVGVFFATLAFAPWQHSPRVEHVRVPLDNVKRPPVIVAMELDAEPHRGLLGQIVDVLTPTYPDVIAPGPHPDAQAWPRGMVIAPPPFPDDMTADIPGALDRLLSGLLAPWFSLAS